MKRILAGACLVAMAAPAAFAQQAGHAQHPRDPAAHAGQDVPSTQDMPGGSAVGHAPMVQPRSTSPALPPPTAEERAHAFPDLGGMDMRDHMDDDPFIATVRIDRLEAFRDHGAAAQEWELHGWAGHRQDRFEWRTRGARVAGDAPDGELELLWSHATGPWWNRTLGLRHDFGEGRDRDWLALGVEGIAPYKIDVAATLYAGKYGIGARVEGSYDLLLTQRIVLQPRLEASGYAGRDAPRDSFEAGLRLRYESSRQFAPYFGYAWSTGEDGSGGHWVAGIRAWF